MAHLVLQIDIGLLGQQGMHHAVVLVVDREEKRARAVVQHSIDIGISVQQLFHHSEEAGFQQMPHIPS
ncbi:hypothetical protein D3C86_2030050 [compost metagenome]